MVNVSRVGGAKAFRGEDGTWGVEQDGAIVYESMFCRRTARAIADMLNSVVPLPPNDWEATRKRLDLMGLPY